MNIHDIVVPVDFSDCSKAALERADDLARRFAARIHLVHVVSPFPYPPEFGYGEEVLEDVEARAVIHLERWAQEIRARGTEIQERIELGRASESVCQLATEVEAQLIVMGTHGHGGIAHGILGSVTTRTSRSAPCPVWIVRETEATDAIRRVLVATDFSPHSEHAVEMAADLCRGVGAALDVVHVFHSPIPFYAEVPNRRELNDEFHRSAMREIEDATSKIDRSGLSVSATVKEGATAAAIVDFAASRDVDLIVVGTRGHQGLKRVFLGSVAEHVAHLAACSVLVASPGPPETSAIGQVGPRR